MTPIQKLAKLALEHPELKGDILAILKRHAAAQEITGPPTTAIYPKEIDHGYEQPLAGGSDIMKRLQDQLLIEQGNTPREPNPRLAASLDLQRGLIAILTGPQGRKVVREVVAKFAADTDTTILINSAVDDIINNAVAVALDPRRMGAVIARHTAEGK